MLYFFYIHTSRPRCTESIHKWKLPSVTYWPILPRQPQLHMSNPPSLPQSAKPNCEACDRLQWQLGNGQWQIWSIQPQERLMESAMCHHSCSLFISKGWIPNLGTLVFWPCWHLNPVSISSLQVSVGLYLSIQHPGSVYSLCPNDFTFLHTVQSSWVSCSSQTKNKNATLSFAALFICSDWPLRSGTFFHHIFILRGFNCTLRPTLKALPESQSGRFSPT